MKNQCWKSLNGLVPSLGLSLSENDGTRSGPKIPLRKIEGPNEKIKNAIRDSLSYFGAKLYNSIPVYIRTFKGTLPQFKKLLDEYIETFPDQPAVGDMVPGAKNIYGNPSNSIIDWSRGMKANIIKLPHYVDLYDSISL